MVGIGNGIQGGFNSTVGIMDSVANNNSFDMINETTQKANKNVAPLGQGNFDLAQGTLAFVYDSNAGEGKINH